MKDKAKEFYDYLQTPAQQKKWDKFCKFGDYPNRKEREKIYEKNMKQIEREAIKNILKQIKERKDGCKNKERN